MNQDEFEILESRIRDELANIARLREELEAKGFLKDAGAASSPLASGFDEADSLSSPPFDTLP